MAHAAARLVTRATYMETPFTVVYVYGLVRHGTTPAHWKRCPGVGVHSVIEWRDPANPEEHRWEARKDRCIQTGVDVYTLPGTDVTKRGDWGTHEQYQVLWALVCWAPRDVLNNLRHVSITTERGQRQC